ncbi:GntR family transcriptional regulator [Nesterenkonia aurantiaca]|uniref:GntR family transcriptional regulator n=1 Tax=Nesterenkonia aurantiaca TaxID=1436010 RepID=UPI003EE55E53
MSAWPLDGVTLDSNSSQPLHSQLASALRDRIRDRRLQPGEALPSDAQLQTQLRVSRSVVRQAMNTLVTEGAIERSRGRGSVVAPARQHHRLAHRAAGLSSQVTESGSEVRTKVLSLRFENNSSHGELDESDTIALERLRIINGIPAAYIHTWLPRRFGADLNPEALTDSSLHQILEAQYGISLTGGTREVRAVAADDQLAHLLDTPKGAPLLLLEGTTTDSEGTVVEVFSTWHRGDLIAFTLDVQEGTGTGSSATRPRHDQLIHAERAATRLAESLRRMID